MRKRAVWPPAEGLPQAGRPVHVRSELPLPATRTRGFVLRPANRTPRRRVSIEHAYDGLPVRVPFAMADLTELAPPQGKHGFARRPPFGEWLPLGGPPETVAGPHSFGFPPAGSAGGFRPRLRPDVPAAGARLPAGGPAWAGEEFTNVTVGAPLPGTSVMRRPRRLSALLPNPVNLWSPARYGTDTPPRG